MTTFTEWFNDNLSEYAQDIAEHGADYGFPHITYTSDTVEIYDQFEDEIYEALNQDAKEFGYSSVDAFVASFVRKDMLATPEGRKNLLVWYMCEREARSK